MQKALFYAQHIGVNPALQYSPCILCSLVQSNKGVGIEALTGVHYGSVTTGVVGTYRWQYKCSGNDLLLAKHVALTGSTG